MKLEVMNFVLKGYENSKHDITFVMHSQKATLIVSRAGLSTVYVQFFWEHDKK